MCVKYFDFQRLAVEFYHKKNNKRQITVCPDLQSPLTSQATSIRHAILYMDKDNEKRWMQNNYL